MPPDVSAAMGHLALVDRDGTLIVDKVYLADPASIEFLPGVVEGLQALRDAGFTIAMVTNQSGIARGHFDHAMLNRIHARLVTLLAEHAVEFAKIYICPHGPNDGCACRKPQPGMIFAAQKELGFDAAHTVFIGDTDSDMGAARAAGVRGIQVVGANGRRAADTDEHVVDFVAAAALAIEQLVSGGKHQCM